MPEESSPQGETFQVDAGQAKGAMCCLPAVSCSCDQGFPWMEVDFWGIFLGFHGLFATVP